MRIGGLATLLLVVIVANAQEKQDHPGYPPTLLLASAVEEGGKVVIQLSRPGPVPPPSAGEAKPGERFQTEWVHLRKVLLGETVQAFGVDGKPMQPKAVLKMLAKPKGVGVFMRSNANDPVTPPAFYRGLFREGTLLLVVNPGDLYNPKP